MVVLNLHPDEQTDFPTIVKAIQEHLDTGLQAPGHYYHQEFKVKGESIRDHRVKLQRWLYGHALQGDIPSDQCKLALDRILTERLIQELLKHTRAFIRERRPESSLQVCVLAEKRFAILEKDLTSWECQKDTTSKYFHKKGRRDWQDRRPFRQQEQREKSPHKEEKKQEKSEDRDSSEQTSNQDKSFQRHHKGRGHWKGKNAHKDNQDNSSQDKKDTASTKCQLCDGTGHRAKDCPSRINKISALWNRSGPKRKLRAEQLHRHKYQMSCSTMERRCPW